jgi:hypothetical protein
MRRHLPLGLIVASLASVGTAQADSTVTQTVPAGGSVRSSPGAPTPQTPLVVIVTNRTPAQPAPTGCPPDVCASDDGTRSFTVSLKDARDRALAPGIEGPSGYVYTGPQADVSSTAAPQNVAVSFELDASVPMPDSLNPNPFHYAVYRSGFGDPFMALGLATGAMPDGDIRLTPDKQHGGGFTGPGSYDVLQDDFFALAYRTDDSLPAAIRNGVSVGLKTNFKVTADWTIKVTESVRRVLRLKSTTIGHKVFAKPGGGDRKVPLTAAARKALRKYSRVVVTANVVARRSDGNVIRDKVKLTLKKPQSDIG